MIWTESIPLLTGKQAVLVLSCDNTHMTEEVMVEPGLVMIFAHGIEWKASDMGGETYILDSW